MAWTESFHCDVCGKAKGDSRDAWWLGWVGTTAGELHSQNEPMLKMTAWNHVQAHGAEVRHLCGARCAQMFLGRWMSGEKE